MDRRFYVFLLSIFGVYMCIFKKVRRVRHLISPTQWLYYEHNMKKKVHIHLYFNKKNIKTFINIFFRTPLAREITNLWIIFQGIPMVNPDNFKWNNKQYSYYMNLTLKHRRTHENLSKRLYPIYSGICNSLFYLAYNPS